MREMDLNEDLRAERIRYYERYAFPLFSHIDFRVSDAVAVRPFYDALMPLFGTEPTTVRVANYGYTRRYGTVRADFFNVFEDPDARPTATRIAFAAPSTDVVDEVARVVRAHGGQKVDGPAYYAQHHPTFYAVFFEDPLGKPPRSLPSPDGQIAVVSATHVASCWQCEAFHPLLVRLLHWLRRRAAR